MSVIIKMSVPCQARRLIIYAALHTRLLKNTEESEAFPFPVFHQHWGMEEALLERQRKQKQRQLTARIQTYAEISRYRVL